MQLFFAKAYATIRTIVDAADNSTGVSTIPSCKQGAGLSKSTYGDSVADDLFVLHGRNGPASGANVKTVGSESQSKSGSARFCDELALANLRDSAQQLGVRYLAAAAAAAVAELGQPAGLIKSGLPVATTAARLLWELRRAEAAWSAAECSGTARVVITAVSTIASAGGALRPMSAALRFQRD